MSRRLLRAICDPRLTAVGLLLLQLGLLSGGHLLHDWMHGLQSADRSCGTCDSHRAAAARPVEHRCGSGPAGEESTLEESAAAGEAACCVGNGHRHPTEDSAASDPNLSSDKRADHCWSWDCAFFRGLHQSTVLAEQVTAVSLDHLLERLAAPADSIAATGGSLTLWARGPPLV